MFANAENTQSESEPRYQPAHYPKERQRVKGKKTASLIPGLRQGRLLRIPFV